MFLFFKRFFDLFFAFIIIVLLSPLFILLMIVQLIFNKGDVFYLQSRMGFHNKNFNIIKFSSMHKDSENMHGGSITVRNDKRVTKVGKILRITKLNELPQLFNVFMGSMSFVGPRPLLKIGFEFYTPDVQSFLYLSKPGITGISSIVFRDEEKLVTKSDLTPEEFYIKKIFPYKGQLEKWYYVNKSLLVDLLILFLTGVKIIAPSSKLEFKIFSSLPENDVV